MSEPTAQESMDQHLKEARAALAAKDEQIELLEAEIRGLKTFADLCDKDRFEVKAALAAMTADRDKWKRQWSEDFEVRTHLLAERDAAITKADKLQAELDAVRKEAKETRDRLIAYLDSPEGRNFMAAQQRDTANRALDEVEAELDTAQARCADLERAIQEAPHSDKCHFAYHPNGWICTCWKSRISPDQKPALKGGDAGMFTKAPPMKGAADVQSESRPASPEHGKAGECGFRPADKNYGPCTRNKLHTGPCAHPPLK